MLELWEMRSTPLVALFPSSFSPELGASDRVQSMGQIELNFVILLDRTIHMYKNGFSIK